MSNQTPNSYRFFRNINCVYYPCHSQLRDINCLFCYCPLFNDDNCGGLFTITQTGIKDCSNCIIPHEYSGYDYIINKL